MLATVQKLTSTITNIRRNPSLPIHNPDKLENLEMLRTLSTLKNELFLPHEDPRELTERMSSMQKGSI